MCQISQRFLMSINMLFFYHRTEYFASMMHKKHPAEIHATQLSRLISGSKQMTSNQELGLLDQLASPDQGDPGQGVS